MALLQNIHVRVVSLAIAVAGCALLAMSSAGHGSAQGGSEAVATPRASTAASRPAENAPEAAIPVASRATTEPEPADPLEREGALRSDAAPARAGTGDGQRELRYTVLRDLPIRERPGAGRVLATLPSSSRHFGTPTAAWVLERSPDKRHGRVLLPWSGTSRTGWVALDSGKLESTGMIVRISIDRRELRVINDGAIVLRAPAAVGATGSPTPRGLAYVTDRVDIPKSAPQFGTFALGLSMIQPNLPAGWTGGNQMAIHGTNDPGSIGSAASAGCLRVAEDVLSKLRKMVPIGTPVVIDR